MIKRVKIKNYKSLKDTELSLTPLTVIMGPNASGKSNLFDALNLLRGIVTGPTIGEAFKQLDRGQPLESFFYGEEGFDALSVKPALSMDLEVDVYLSDSAVKASEDRIQSMRKGDASGANPSRSKIIERNLRYAVSIEMDTKTGQIRVLNEKLCALTSKGLEKSKTSRKPFLEKEGNRLHLRMEKEGHPIYHEIGLDHSVLSKPLFAPHYPHIDAFKEEVSRWRFYYLEPRSIMRKENPLSEVKHLSSQGADLSAFLHTLKTTHEKQFRNLEKSISALIPSITSIDVERDKLGQLLLHTFESKTKVSARLMSEGTLRLIALLAILNPISLASVIGIEEPENGVHPRRIQLIAELLQAMAQTTDAQILVNTHSPILPGNIPPKNIVVCEIKNHMTSFKPLTDLGSLFRQERIDNALEEKILRGDFGG